MRADRLRQMAGGLLLLGVALVTALGLWQTSPSPRSEFEVCRARPAGIMGTIASLVAIARDRARGRQALARAEVELRQVEALMSARLDTSDVWRLNGAGAGEEVVLSPDTFDVLRAAKDAYRDTEGAFDITCGNLLEFWRGQVELSSGRKPQPLSERAFRQARSQSNWDLLELTEAGARKRVATVRVDLGGLAKGHGIDRAVAALKEAGMLGGLVDVGGDLRCFGRPPEGERWTVDVRSPFGEGVLLSLAIREGAVCTSGNYARFIEVEGRRYSHIVDPRTGRPADAAPSVTVLAPTAREADIWATALSVLGEEGLAWLPSGVDGMLVLGTAEGHRIVCTPGFAEAMEQRPARVAIVGKSAVTEARPAQDR